MWLPAARGPPRIEVVGHRVSHHGTVLPLPLAASSYRPSAFTIADRRDPRRVRESAGDDATRSRSPGWSPLERSSHGCSPRELYGVVHAPGRLNRACVSHEREQEVVDLVMQLRQLCGEKGPHVRVSLLCSYSFARVKNRVPILDEGVVRLNPEVGCDHVHKFLEAEGLPVWFDESLNDSGTADLGREVPLVESPVELQSFHQDTGEEGT